MARQRVLERAGWTFWRCFASTWSMKRQEVLQELIGRLAAMGIEPIGAMERVPELVEYREWPPATQTAAPVEAEPSEEAALVATIEPIATVPMIRALDSFRPGDKTMDGNRQLHLPGAGKSS
jgi:hypothetical protein